MDANKPIKVVGRFDMHPITRREMLGLIAGAAPALCVAPSVFGAGSAGRQHLGVCSYSYNLHWKAAREGHPKARFKDPLEFLEYSPQLGAAGGQVAMGSWDPGV